VRSAQDAVEAFLFQPRKHTQINTFIVPESKPQFMKNFDVLENFCFFLPYFLPNRLLLTSTCPHTKGTFGAVAGKFKRFYSTEKQ
jgi:hypothetical protein